MFGNQRSSSLLLVLGALGALARVPVAAADVLPAGRRTNWNPGIPGGIPVRTTVCATVNASTYGNGTQNATEGIQAAIDACPVGQVVQLSAGDFLVNGPFPLRIDKGVVLRGMGPQATKLRKTSSAEAQLIVIGVRWLDEAASVDLTANVAKGATSVRVTSTAGFSVGQLVLLDELTDDSFVYWGIDPAAAPGGPARGWFTRYDRPVGQMLEIASISGDTVSFTTPLHIAFDTAHRAQLTRFVVPYGARYAGLENLYVRGGRNGNITMRLAMYSWMKNVESDWSLGDSIAIDSCFRCVLRDSYVHDTADPNPGGGGYLLSVGEYTADSLVENSIFINANKVMVMRASGGGNVIGYNYFDNGYIESYPGWMETGLNPSHMTCPHFELFEGNQAFNADPDDTWGGAVYNTFFRNHLTGKRRSFDDIDSRRAAGLMWGHYYYSFVGNVLGTADQNPAPYHGFTYEDLYPWGDDPVPMWRIGYTPNDWNAPAEARVVNTTHRHANFDYATSTVRWESGYDQTLPDSLYLTGKPAFFGSLPWPWVDPTGTTKTHTLPARARYDAGTPPASFTLSVVRSGDGTGTVTSSPAGISCGTDCQESYDSGTQVTLTAAAATGSSFSGWSGGGCGGTGSCLVTMNAPQTVTAAFDGTTISIGDASLVEGHSGARALAFPVTLSAPSSQTITVDYATSDGTATTANGDYLARSGRVTFTPSAQAASVEISVVGDTILEPDETFRVLLSNAVNSTTVDGEALGRILNDDAVAPSSRELGHGSTEWHDLSGLDDGTAGVDVYRLHQESGASYEAVVDGISGNALPLMIDRIASDGTTVEQTSVTVGVGSVASLRWRNSQPTAVTAERLQVRSGGCTTTCGPNHRYRIRFYETTGTIPRFNNSGTQTTVVMLHNPRDVAIAGTLSFWSAAGALSATQNFTVGPRALFTLNTASLPGLSGRSGSITVAHDGPYAGLVGKAVALEAATGFSFDVPMTARPK